MPDMPDMPGRGTAAEGARGLIAALGLVRLVERVPGEWLSPMVIRLTHAAPATSEGA